MAITDDLPEIVGPGLRPIEEFEGQDTLIDDLAGQTPSIQQALTLSKFAEKIDRLPESARIRAGGRVNPLFHLTDQGQAELADQLGDNPSTGQVLDFLRSGSKDPLSTAGRRAALGPLADRQRDLRRRAQVGARLSIAEQKERRQFRRQQAGTELDRVRGVATQLGLTGEPLEQLEQQVLHKFSDVMDRPSIIDLHSVIAEQHHPEVKLAKAQEAFRKYAASPEFENGLSAAETLISLDKDGNIDMTQADKFLDTVRQNHTTLNPTADPAFSPKEQFSFIQDALARDFRLEDDPPKPEDFITATGELDQVAFVKAQHEFRVDQKEGRRLEAAFRQALSRGPLAINATLTREDIRQKLASGELRPGDRFVTIEGKVAVVQENGQPVLESQRR